MSVVRLVALRESGLSAAELRASVPIWKHQLFGGGSEWVGTP